MSVLFLDEADVRRLLPMDECIEVMRETLATLAGGDAVQPLRQAMFLPSGDGLLGTMPGWLGGTVTAPGIKVVTVFPGNHGTAYDSHQGPVLLFEGEHGCLVAIVDGTAVTAIRTAAVSAVATDVLARPDARTLAVLGSGVQAGTHIEALLRVRPIERVAIWSRSTDGARALAQRLEPALDAELVAAPSAEAAVRDADIVCTTTSASEPVLHGAWLAPGAHVNAVGSCTPRAREVDTEAMRRARVYTDRRESLLAEAGDFLIPMQEGAFGDEHCVGEVGEVLTGSTAGRRDADEITLFESLGLAVEDVAAAHHIHRKALEAGAGIALELGGRRAGASRKPAP